jgi:hypothetical protein
MRGGGHWFHYYDEDPPEWYEERYEKTTRRTGDKKDLPEEHQPDLEDWDPSDYSAYYCVICREACINPTESIYTEARECRHCMALPSLEDAPDDDGTDSGSCYVG